MTDDVAQQMPIISAAVGQCTGCGGLLFADLFHICAANLHLHEGSISREVLAQLLVTSYIAAPPTPTTAGMLTDPPALNVTNDRTHCEACRQALDPSVVHCCAGNN